MLLVYELQLPGNTDKPKTHFSRAAGTIAGLGGFFSRNLVLMEKYKFGNGFY